MGDLQCAWQLMLQCAGPRCHHVLRTAPLTLWMGWLLEDQQQQEVARMVANLPMKIRDLHPVGDTQIANGSSDVTVETEFG